ncbi:DUF423 domain-containing protein [Providencia alcalifaciens]|uniref:DUF423 domain-containing protein n=1 Tax=Providencia alcalifaciens TaxID=126385 RepID=UPI000447861F|nr:DUF423 domain-containing protein [Providencia alcalifaciens]EUD05379.1 PF04241 family protein [Providencia alcalifaciens R90-1475]
MNSRLMLIFAGISGFFVVAFGAIGSHALAPMMSSHQMAWIETGLRYQMFHTVALMVLGAVLLRKVILWFYWAGVFFSVGILLFSGSLYCMALLQVKYFSYFTPIGGVCFLVGWLLAVIGAMRLRKLASRNE